MSSWQGMFGERSRPDDLFCVKVQKYKLKRKLQDETKMQPPPKPQECSTPDSLHPFRLSIWYWTLPEVKFIDKKIMFTLDTIKTLGVLLVSNSDFCSRNRYWTLSKVKVIWSMIISLTYGKPLCIILAVPLTVSLLNVVLNPFFQPKPHLSILGYDPKKWAGASKDKVYQRMKLLWHF